MAGLDPGTTKNVINYRSRLLLPTGRAAPTAVGERETKAYLPRATIQFPQDSPAAVEKLLDPTRLLDNATKSIGIAGGREDHGR